MQVIDFWINTPVFSLYKPVGYSRKAFTNLKKPILPSFLLFTPSYSCQYLFSISGKSGDWKNVFHDCQSRDFDDVYEVQMQDSHLKSMWTCKDMEMTATNPARKDRLHSG